MENFTTLKQRAAEQKENRIEERLYYIENGFCVSWTEEYKIHSDEGIKNYSTDLRWKQYNDKIIDRETAVKLASKRAIKDIEKSYNKDIEKIKAAENAVEVSEIYINVKWVKNSYWGYNPNVTVDVITVDGKLNTFYGSASGCGYDKETAAVGEALNQSASVLKMLYNKADESIPDNFNNNKTSLNYRSSIGYGSGYDYLPYFEGGVGISCFQNIFKTCGYNFECTSYTKHYTSYKVSKI